ncbi:MAG TPA: hypothetical protein PKE05_01435 [Microthrixaceae bacterium]|mgnify:FL=1|nr:hypothetical protein [Microthrixaceae bacterium]
MDPTDENSISVLGRDLLLVDVGGGAETHLAEVADGPGVPLDTRATRVPRFVGRWSDSTLCGRTWNRMPADADELLPEWRDPAFAPTCRGCLRILDSWFPTADTPSGVWLLAAVAAEEVTRFSSTYVTAVPVEHVEATRAAIRKVLRANGLGSSTRVVEGVVHVWSDDAYEAIDPAEIRDSVTSAIERMTTGVDTAPDRDPDSTPGPIDWHTWVIE